MHPISSSPGRLPPEWRAALQAHEIRATAVPMDRREPSRCTAPAGPAPYLHSGELLALVARLRRERVRQGLSLGNVARATGQARSAISRLENGRYPNPTLDTVCRYALALGMHVALAAVPLVAGVVAEVDGPATLDSRLAKRHDPGSRLGASHS